MTQSDNKKVARGIIIDEAGALDRSSTYYVTYYVWGNNLLPCLLGGDPKQLRPVVMSKNDTDAEGKPLNRYTANGEISILEIMLANGYPAHRMHNQLRMANGLFDLVHGRGVATQSPCLHHHDHRSRLAGE